MINFKRIFKTGFLAFTRNGIVSVASVIIMTITLSVLSGVLLFEHVLESTLENVENKVDVSVYFVPGADEDAIMALKHKVENVPEVASTTYTSEKDALADFRARHANDQTTLQALDELDDNPIGGMLSIKAKDISQYASISKFFDDPSALGVGSQSIIDSVDYNTNKEDIDIIHGILEQGRLLGLLVTLVFMVLSILITFNTIRLAIFFAKEEISVMRLVGASRWHVQGPFLVEGLFYGIISTLVTLIIFLPITYWFGRHMTDFFQGINLFKYYVSHLYEFVIILLLFSVALGAFSSFLATRKYLKV